MTVFKPRSRMISIRVSEDEYAALRNLCLSTGARSVSDLTRDAMHALIRGSLRDNPNDMSGDDLRVRVKNLDERVDQLAAKFSSLQIVLGR